MTPDPPFRPYRAMVRFCVGVCVLALAACGEPEARSRLNALLFTGMFIGMATGATLGSLVLSQGGWPGSLR